MTSLIMCLQIAMIATTFATLVFHTLPPSFKLLGICMLIVGSAIFMFVFSTRSEIPFTVTMTQDGVIPVFSLLIAGIIQTLSLSEAGIAESTAFAAMMITTFITGCFLYFLGAIRLTTLIKSVPFAVIGGFFTGVGTLLMIGGLKASLITSVNCATITLPSGTYCFWPIFLSLTFAFSMIFLINIFKNSLTMPIVFFIFIFGFFITITFLNISFSTLVENALVYETIQNSLIDEIRLLSFDKVNWHSILMQYGNIFSIAMIAAFSALFNLASIEVHSDKISDFNRDIKTIGFSNLIASLFGSSVGYPSFVMSIMNLKMNGFTRLPTLITPFMLLSLVLFFPKIILLLPRFILTGMLIFLGVRMIHIWAIKTYKTLPVVDYLMLVSIAVTIIFFGAFLGTLFGMIVATILFAINYSKISPIRYMVDGTEIASNIQYESSQKNILLENGEQLLFVSLQNYLFFGTANYLMEQIIFYLEKNKKVRFILFDFLSVLGLDSSSEFSLSKMIRLATASHAEVLFCNVHALLEKQLKELEVTTLHAKIRIFQDSNDALIWYETSILGNPYSHQTIPLTQLFSYFNVAIPETTLIEHYFHQLSIKKDEILCKQNEDADELYYLQSGELDSYLISPIGNRIHLRRLMPGNIIGEMGFYLEEKRSATIIAKTNCEIQTLTRDSFEKMQKQDPEIAAALGVCIIKMLSERLSFTNKEISKFRGPV